MLDTVAELFGKFNTVILQLIRVAFYVVTAVFAWGIIQYFTAAGDEKKLAEARNYLLYGIVTLAVMLSAWSLVWILINSFRLR